MGEARAGAARDLPPGRRGPALLNGLRFARDPLGYVRWYHARFGLVTSSRIPGVGLAIHIAEPQLVKQVFTADPSVFHAGEANATMLEPTVGSNSLLTLDGAAHMRQRKLLLAPFHGRSVVRWERAIAEIAHRDMESWPVGKPFALRSRSERITLDVILRAVFGVRDQRRLQRARVLVRRFAERAHLITLFAFTRHNLGPWSPWPRFMRARSALDAFLYEEIALRRSEPDVAEREDVLSLLLGARDEDGQPMSDAELRDELVTVIGAGHETTATAIAWTFERLLRNADVMARLKSSLGEGDAYLEATIKEALRIRPVITDAARRLTRDVELAGYRLPAGALVLPSIAAIHFREDIYPQPEQFRPERFLHSTPDSYTWIPFGGGVRRCVGASFAQLEMRVIIRAILERADLRATTQKDEFPRMTNITVAPDKGCRVLLAEPLRARRFEQPREHAGQAAGWPEGATV